MAETPLPEELIRRVSKTALHAAEKGRRSLFEKVTAGHQETIDQAMEEKPVFYENKEGKTEITLDPNIAELMPPEFFDNPTKWIESQKMVKRGDENYLPELEHVRDLWDRPYDTTKVKSFIVGPDKDRQVIVSKRIDKKEEEEIEIAKAAHAAGIPTPAVLGEIRDKGNHYAFFEYVAGFNMSAARGKQWIGDDEFSNISIVGHYNIIEPEKMLEKLYKRYGDRRQAKKMLDNLTENAEILGKLSAAVTLRQQAAKFLTPWQHYESQEQAEEDLIFPLNRAEIQGDSYGRGVASLLRSLGCGSPPDVLDYMKQISLLAHDSRKLYDYLKKHHAKELAEALERQGMTDLEEWDKAWEHELRNEPEKLYHTPKNLVLETIFSADKLREQVREMREKIHHFDDLAYFGCDVVEEQNKIAQLCDQKGIRHKDFADRNFIIPWDFKKDRPKKTKNEQPKLYIIDWEQKTSSKNVSDKQEDV